MLVGGCALTAVWGMVLGLPALAVGPFIAWTISLIDHPAIEIVLGAGLLVFVGLLTAYSGDERPEPAINGVMIAPALSLSRELTNQPIGDDRLWGTASAAGFAMVETELLVGMIAGLIGLSGRLGWVRGLSTRASVWRGSWLAVVFVAHAVVDFLPFSSGADAFGWRKTIVLEGVPVVIGSAASAVFVYVTVIRTVVREFAQRRNLRETSTPG